MSGSGSSTFKTRATPGVYLTELSAVPSSIIGVPTAVPIFVGYTETAKAPSSGNACYLQAISLNSMAGYESFFGAGFHERCVVEPVGPTSPSPTPPLPNYDFQAASTDIHGTATIHLYALRSTHPSDPVMPRFNLYTALRLFFANGGGDCFVVSVGNYWGAQSTTPAYDQSPVAVSASDLLAGLAVTRDMVGPTMLVVPDACLLTAKTGDSDYGKIAVAMLNQASSLQDRVAILDLPGALNPADWTNAGLTSEAEAFYAAIAPAQSGFSFGAAYAPALESSALTASDVDYTSLRGSAGSSDTMNMLLTTQAIALYPPTGPASAKFNDVALRIGAAFPPSTDATGPRYAPYRPDAFPAPASVDGISALDGHLRDAVPLLAQVEQILVSKLNVAPPSGIMAGIWTANDANRGVWSAPANVALASVVAPKVVLTDEEQEQYNVPSNGCAIDILRAFVNRGIVVWGARTLDGNSLDYRYIQVRRTLIYIEQSIRLGLQSFVFAPNDAGTWTTVTAAISNFLTQLWQQGGLMGSKPSDAFTVQCGVPATMTGQDIINGYMIVNVTLQMVHPAEFIELTFTQAMQGA